MAVIRLFLCGLLALLIGGCGQTVTETLHIPANAPPQPACDATVVVLPFADYSYGDDIATAHKRNLAIAEALNDNLVSRGFKMPVSEDVFGYLVDNGIVSLVPYEGGKGASGYGSVEAELQGGWSGLMKDELRKLIAMEQSTNPLETPGTHALDLRTITAIGKQFGAGYVVRGRIIEYRQGQEHTWDPRKLGVLPFIVGTTSKTMFGIASSEEYDLINAVAIGGVTGALIGNAANAPYEPLDSQTIITPTATTTITSGTGDHAALNSLVWGAGGAAAAYLAHKSGDTPQAIVELRLWVQDTATGEVVWTNRADVRVSPESVFADSDSQNLFNAAVQRAVASLVDDFWNKTKVRL